MPAAVITCKLHPSGFARSDSNFDSLSVASDGCLYYTLCSHHIDTHARVYRLQPGGDPVCLGDLGEIVGEAGDGEQYFCLCRSIAVDPRDGSAYFTNADGGVRRYCYETGAVERMRTAGGWTKRSTWSPTRWLRAAMPTTACCAWRTAATRR